MKNSYLEMVQLCGLAVKMVPVLSSSSCTFFSCFSISSFVFHAAACIYSQLSAVIIC